jgi:hypothetical protein
MNAKFNLKKNKGQLDIINFIVSIFFLFIFPNIIIPNHPFLALIIGIILDGVIFYILTAYSRQWKFIK